MRAWKQVAALVRTSPSSVPSPLFCLFLRFSEPFLAVSFRRFAVFPLFLFFVSVSVRFLWAQAWGSRVGAGTEREAVEGQRGGGREQSGRVRRSAGRAGAAEEVQREGWCGSGWRLVEAFVVVGERPGGVGRSRLLEASCGGAWVRVRRHTTIAMRVGIPGPLSLSLISSSAGVLGSSWLWSPCRGLPLGAGRGRGEGAWG